MSDDRQLVGDALEASQAEVLLLNELLQPTATPTATVTPAPSPAGR